MNTCHYCHQPIAEPDQVKTTSYWFGGALFCHRACKDAGFQSEVLECQTIDADCNDCKHFQRGEVVKRLLTFMEHGKSAQKLTNMGVVNGYCAKFNRATQAFPNKWTGHECFEHRKS